MLLEGASAQLTCAEVQVPTHLWAPRRVDILHMLDILDNTNTVIIVIELIT